MKGRYIAAQLASKGVKVFDVGPDISTGWFAINCLYCRDPGAHLVVNNEHGGWHCWRCNAKGRGEKLLSYFGISTGYIPADGVREIDTVSFLKGIFENEVSFSKKPNIAKTDLKLLDSFNKEFSPLVKGSGKQYNSIIPQVVFDYVKNRGIGKELSYELGFCYTDSGPYAFRLIIPVFYQGRLVNYVARDITGNARARYKTCLNEEANMHLSSVVWNYDRLEGKEVKVLYICEGIFDTLSFGVDKATCCFKAFLSPLQILLLKSLSVAEYRIVFDKGALEGGITAARRLSTICSGVSVWLLDDEVEDPGSVKNPEDKITLLVEF